MHECSGVLSFSVFYSRPLGSVAISVLAGNRTHLWCVAIAAPEHQRWIVSPAGWNEDLERYSCFERCHIPPRPPSKDSKQVTLISRILDSLSLLVITVVPLLEHFLSDSLYALYKGCFLLLSSCLESAFGP